MVYRNVEQLELHLAALENGVGKDREATACFESLDFGLPVLNQYI